MLSQPITSSSFRRLLDQAPFLPRCSDNKTAMLVRPREYAIRWPYMQVNRKDMIAWLVFDIDHENKAFPNPYIWQDEGLPAPNLIVRNRYNNKAHLYYAIVPVCISDHARSKPIQYLKAVYQAMALRLRADLAYSGPVAKTPFHPWWQTTELHSQVYELGELADSVELETVQYLGERRSLQYPYHSRNCTLFEQARQYAYSIVNTERQQGSYDRFKRRITHFATYKNCSFVGKPALRHSEVMSVVKSVSRWTWDKYHVHSNRTQSVMRLSSDLSVKERQSLSAMRTHQIRREKTRKRVINACHVLSSTNEELNITSIAKCSKLCRKTVRRYFHEIQFLFEPRKSPQIIPIISLLKPINGGSYAVHQITAFKKAPFVVWKEGRPVTSVKRAPLKWLAYLNVADG